MYLRPEFQNLFNISYFTGSKELVPVGWGAVDEDKSYPLISSRIPEVSQDVSDDDDDDIDERVNAFSTATRRTPSEAASSDAEEDDAPQLPQTRMTEESSSEDELALTSNVSRVRFPPTSLSIYAIAPILLYRALRSVKICKCNDLIESRLCRFDLLRKDLVLG